jgi:hypothetical protein
MANFGGAPHDDNNIQDLWYALAEAGLLSGTLEDDAIADDAFKTRGYALQPDGDLVGDMATGEIFATTQDLAQGEEFVSDWYDTDGFSSIEVFAGSTEPSVASGVKFEFTDDVQGAQDVQATYTREYGDESAERGYEIFKTETNLDGFRFRFQNNSTAVTDVDFIGTLKNTLSLDGANYVTSNTLGNNYVRIGTDDNAQGLKVGDPSSLFGDLVSIERKTVIDLSSTFGTSQLRDETSSTGSGSISQNPDTSTGEIVLSTGTTPDSSIQLRSAEYGRYTPGYSAQQGVGIRIPALPTEGEARWGYFNGTDGFYWGYDGSAQELFVGRRKAGSEAQRIYRSNWNRNAIDTVLDSSWSPNEGSIFQIDFSWYGYGIILFTIVDQTANDLRNTSPRQESVVVHALVVDNETSTADPNQPITVEAENGANGEDFDVRVGGRQFSVFGQGSSESRITAQNRSGIAVDDTAWTYIMGWRRKDGEANSNLNVRSIQTLQTGDTKYALVVNPNVSAENYGGIELVNPDETLLEVSTTGSFDGIGTGTKVFESLASGGGGKKTAGGDLDEIDISIGQNTNIILLARGVDASSTVDTTMSFIEDW